MNKHLLLAVLDEKSTRVERMVFGNRSIKRPLLGVDCYCGELKKRHLLALAKDVVKEDSLQITCQLLKALTIQTAVNTTTCNWIKRYYVSRDSQLCELAFACFHTTSMSDQETRLLYTFILHRPIDY